MATQYLQIYMATWKDGRSTCRHNEFRQAGRVVDPVVRAQVAAFTNATSVGPRALAGSASATSRVAIPPSATPRPAAVSVGGGRLPRPQGTAGAELARARTEGASFVSAGARQAR